MPAWLVWLIAAGALAAAETVSLTFVLIMLAGGAVAGAATAALGGPVFVQVLVAVAASGALLGAVRPAATRRLGGDQSRTGTDALPGMEAVVISAVDQHDGRVRLNGAEWSARAFDPAQAIPAGTVVRVMQISGATALVWQEPAQ
jgi:membrane protein implicated in regulation of membrane protease activity